MAKQNFNDFYGEESSEMTTTTTSETTKERVSVEENARLNKAKFDEVKLMAKERANRFLNNPRIKELKDHGFDIEYHINVTTSKDIYMNVYVSDTKNPVYADIPWKRNNHYLSLGKITGGKYNRLFLSQDEKSKQWSDNYNGFVGAVCNEVKTFLFLREFPVINEEIVTDDGSEEVEEQMNALEAEAA